MPPKTKGDSKRKKEVDPEEQLRQDLLLVALSLRGEKERETSLEGHFLSQTELLKGYWETDKKTRDERRRILNDRDHRFEGIKDKHTIDLGVYKQQIKQLLFANQDEISAKTSELFSNLQSLADGHHNEFGQLYNDVHDISNRMAETTRTYDTLKLSISGDCNDEMTALREEASRRVGTLAIYYEQKFKRTREDYEKRLTNETTELDSKNEHHIQLLKETNKREMQQLRTSNNTTMTKNLDRIATLRREAVLLREQDRHDRRILKQLHDRNKDIVVPLETNKSVLLRLQKDVVEFHMLKRDLDAEKEDLRLAQEELQEIEWDHEVLFQKLQALVKETVELKIRAHSTILEAQQTSNFQNLMLERKLKRSSNDGERDMAALVEDLQKAHIIDLDTLNPSPGVFITDISTEKMSEATALRQRLKQIKDAQKALREKHRALMEGGAVV